MAFEHETPVRELALRCRGAIPIFEAAGIDYYCEGHRSLSSACSAAHADVGGIAAKLSAAAAAPDLKPENDWRRGTLVAFLAHLDARFHRAHCAELANLTAYFDSIAVQAEDESLQALGPILRALGDVSEAHRITATTLFADAMAVEAGATLLETALPPAVRVLHNLAREHVRIRSLLQAARSVTGMDVRSGRTPNRVRAALHARLAAWEKEAHGHAHLENNVLVPWTSELDPVTSRKHVPFGAAGEVPMVLTP